MTSIRRAFVAFITLVLVAAVAPATASATRPAAPRCLGRVATIVVVVVLPCVPAMAMLDFSRISSASISARRTMGRPRRRASSSSGLPFLIAVEMTMTPAPATFSARWPSKTVAPRVSSRSVILDFLESLPWTR